ARSRAPEGRIGRGRRSAWPALRSRLRPWPGTRPATTLGILSSGSRGGDVMVAGAAEIPGLVRGLEGVIAAPTAICDLDGVNGRLAYGGYDIADLAEPSSFEETVYLLWPGELPSAEQLAALTRELAHNRSLPEPLVQTMGLYPKRANSMAALRA